MSMAQVAKAIEVYKTVYEPITYNGVSMGNWTLVLRCENREDAARLAQLILKDPENKAVAFKEVLS